ncbi:hypothetical protein [Chryseobacterium ginsenosidimutans]|uniref:hypothetical protein n=1 Tax=Chryseobacterium ginsenosidimutans TaxID=687846 RepID=UPI0027BA9867|nr:hypothetical protein [Chryseobacterium ginsenosidimutans]
MANVILDMSLEFERISPEAFAASVAISDIGYTIFVHSVLLTILYQVVNSEMIMPILFVLSQPIKIKSFFFVIMVIIYTYYNWEI